MTQLVYQPDFTQELTKRNTPGNPRAYIYDKIMLVVLESAWEYYEQEHGIPPIIDMVVTEFANQNKDIDTFTDIFTMEITLTGLIDDKEVNDEVTCIFSRNIFHKMPQLLIGRQAEAKLYLEFVQIHGS